MPSSAAHYNIKSQPARFPTLIHLRTGVLASAEESVVLEVGREAPDFELPAVTGDRRHRVRLSSFRGKKNVVLAFYPLDWTPT